MFLGSALPCSMLHTGRAAVAGLEGQVSIDDVGCFSLLCRCECEQQVPYTPRKKPIHDVKNWQIDFTKSGYSGTTVVGSVIGVTSLLVKIGAWDILQEVASASACRFILALRRCLQTSWPLHELNICHVVTACGMSQL